MDPPPIDLQGLIEETEALELTIPAHLETVEEASSAQKAYALIGKILSLRTLHSQHVMDTMVNAWSFASPLAMEVLAPKKFLFAVPLQSHIDRILQQGPWNVRGSLLLLHPWTRALALNEVELFLCPFWIQIHGLPQQNMTVKNAIRIGKALGTLLDVENGENPGLICRQHLRIRVEINTNCPLVPGFFISRPNRDPLWVNFKYERLADYCILCGLIGHKRFSCPDPPRIPPANYSIPLSAASPTYPRVFPSNQNSQASSGPSDLGRSVTLPISQQGNEFTQLQLVTRQTQSKCVPISATFQQATPVMLDERHVSQPAVPLRISGPKSTEPTHAAHPLQLHTKIPSSDKGKSPLYTEKSASINFPDKTYPYPQDFDKPPKISSTSPAPPFQPTSTEKGLPLFSNPAQFLECISTWANSSAWPGFPSTQIHQTSSAQQQHAYPTISPSFSTSSAQTLSSRNPLPQALNNTRYHPYARAPAVVQPTSPPQPTISSPLPPTPSPPLSPEFQSGQKNKKRINIPDDDLTLAYLFKQKKLKHLDQIVESQMSMAADSLAAMKYSRLPEKSAHFQAHESSLTEVPIISSSDLQESSKPVFYGALRKKDSISGIPRQIVTSTEALMARPPVLSRRFSRAPMGRPLFMPTVYDDVNYGSNSQASAVDKGVDLLRPPPHQ